MGGSIAVYLALLFNELVSDRAKVATRGIVFGAAPTLSPACSRAVRGLITSFSHENDLVNALSYGHCLECFDRAVEATGAASPNLNATPFKLYPAGTCVQLSRDGTMTQMDPVEFCPRIYLGAGTQVLTDHFPPGYEAALKKAVAKYPVPNVDDGTH